jgi:hypothetical protein
MTTKMLNVLHERSSSNNAFVTIITLLEVIAKNHNRDNNNDNHDPFAKVKFSFLAFYDAHDDEAYLDLEMTVEQNSNS